MKRLWCCCPNQTDVWKCCGLSLSRAASPSVETQHFPGSQKLSSDTTPLQRPLKLQEIITYLLYDFHPYCSRAVTQISCRTHFLFGEKVIIDPPYSKKKEKKKKKVREKSNACQEIQVSKQTKWITVHPSKLDGQTSTEIHYFKKLKMCVLNKIKERTATKTWRGRHEDHRGLWGNGNQTLQMKNFSGTSEERVGHCIKSNWGIRRANVIHSS